jgi:hypothetical protein
MEGRSEAAIGAFKRNYDQLVAGVTGLVCVEMGLVLLILAALRAPPPPQADV